MPLMLREQIEEWEARSLAPYAAKSRESRGRVHHVESDGLRPDFQRDRDRVIHCTTFRKLEFKTQVFLTTVSDFNRSRLTHTMEVAQIARTLARALNLNPDLSEAIALAHDLGHTPFGHAGEDAMQVCMKDHGGFEHNLQGLRVVELLEERYPSFPGLNLTYEVREGIIKHHTEYDAPKPHPDYNPGKSPSLESQLVDLADEIAYNNADLDDAFEMGFLSVEDFAAVPWVKDVFDRAARDAGKDPSPRTVKYRALAKLYDLHVNDALAESSKRIEASGVRSIQDVYNHPGRLVSFSKDFAERMGQLQKFLLEWVYLSPQNLVSTNKARKFVRELFEHYLAHPGQLPWKHQARVEREGLHQTICDYIQGMTDRYLMKQYREAFLPDLAP